CSRSSTTLGSYLKWRLGPGGQTLCSLVASVVANQEGQTRTCRSSSPGGSTAATSELLVLLFVFILAIEIIEVAVIILVVIILVVLEVFDLILKDITDEVFWWNVFLVGIEHII